MANNVVKLHYYDYLNIREVMKSCDLSGSERETLKKVDQVIDLMERLKKANEEKEINK